MWTSKTRRFLSPWRSRNTGGQNPSPHNPYQLYREVPAPDFKLYYLLLDRLIRTADFGYSIDELDEKLYLQLVADDSMSWVSSPEELQAVITLFEYYADKYAMTFCFPKTLINCYGKKEDVEQRIAKT